MAIKWAEDLGAPAIVAAVDIVVEQQKPTWSRGVGIGLSAMGYILGGVMNIGGTFVKNIGIAAAPWAMESVYEWIKEGTASPVTSRMQMRSGVGSVANKIANNAGSRITRSYQPEFETASAF